MLGKFAKALQTKEVDVQILPDLIKVSGRLLYNGDSPAVGASYEKIPTTLFLASSLEVIEKWGFTSVTKGSAGHPSTAIVAEQELLKKSPAFSYVSCVPEIIQWCNDTLAPNASDEIIQRALSYLMLPEVTREQASFLPYLVSLWVAKGTSAYVGKVGDCIVRHLLCTQILRYNNSARSGYGFKFKDPKSNVYLWWTEKPEILGPDPVGKTFHKAFRVKGHKLWKGMEETVIHYVLPPDSNVENVYTLNRTRQAMNGLTSSLGRMASSFPTRSMGWIDDDDEEGW